MNKVNARDCVLAARARAWCDRGIQELCAGRAQLLERERGWFARLHLGKGTEAAPWSYQSWIGYVHRHINLIDTAISGSASLELLE